MDEWLLWKATIKTQFFHHCSSSLTLPSGVKGQRFLVEIMTVIWTTLIPSCWFLEQLHVPGTLKELWEDDRGLLTYGWLIVYLLHSTFIPFLSDTSCHSLTSDRCWSLSSVGARRYITFNMVRICICGVYFFVFHRIKAVYNRFMLYFPIPLDGNPF